MEFLFITASDIHISDTGPRSRVDDFKATMLGKISQVRTVCDKLGADGCILAGDLYNLKQPARNSHRLNQDLIKEFKRFPCPIYMIEGNHDLTANRIDSLEEQPLGVLFADRTLIQLRHEVIEKEGHKVSLVGVPYTDNLDLSSLKIPQKKDCIAQICVMHIYAGSKAGMLFKERLYGYDELAGLGPDIFVLGHYHVDQGIQVIPQPGFKLGKHFISLGSVSRGTLSEENLDHHPQIGMVKISVEEGSVSYNIRPIKLKVKPVSEVFDLVKREEEQKESLEIQAFVERLASEVVSEAVNSDKTMEEIIDSMQIAKVVKDRAMHFIQAAAAENAP